LCGGVTSARNRAAQVVVDQLVYLGSVHVLLLELRRPVNF
jgi:hypothetical protein